MAAPHFTPTALLMDRMVREAGGAGLVDVVLRLQDEGLTWREIALRLCDETGIRVSHETVRSWGIEWRHTVGRVQETAA